MALNPCFPLQKYLTITQGYKPTHVGNDYGWTSAIKGACNQPIIAVESGTVVKAVDGYGNTYPNARIYGNYVIIAHGNNTFSLYGHLNRGIAVHSGTQVNKGDVIGYMGNSGYSMGQHLHFEYRIGGNSKTYAVDPLSYLTVNDDALIISDKTLYPDRIKKNIEKNTIGTPVEKDNTKDQLYIKINNLNARTGAGTDSTRLGFVTPGYYNVIREIQGDAYKWYEIEPGVFVAFSDSWAYYYPKEQAKLYNCSINGITTGDKNKVVALGKEIGIPAVVTEV